MPIQQVVVSNTFNEFRITTNEVIDLVNGLQDGTANLTANVVSSNTLSVSGDVSFTSTGAMLVPKGTLAEQPATPVAGMLRYNTTTNEFEGYSGANAQWTSVGSGDTVFANNDTTTNTYLYPAFLNATTNAVANIYSSDSKLLYKPSTGELKANVVRAQNGLIVNDTTISEDYTIETGTNALSVGPITVAAGATVTVSGGQRWVVI